MTYGSLHGAERASRDICHGVHFILVFVATVSPCGSHLRVNKNFTFDNNVNEGMVVLSARSEDNCRGISNSVVLMFRESSSRTEMDGFFLENTFLSKDFENPPGCFLVKTLPAGTYTFTRLAKTGVMQGAADIEHHDLTFTVIPEKIQYSGEIQANIASCSAVEILVKDMQDRDKNLLDQRMTQLSSFDFEYQIMKVPGINNKK